MPINIATTTRGPVRLANDAAPLALVWLLLSTSSFVLIEPAPFDLAFIALFGLFMLLGLRIPARLLSLITLLAGWIGFSLIGTANGVHFSDSLRHVGITGLLCAVSLFIACIVCRYRERGLRAVLNGWTFAALGASALGILGYFGVLGSISETFLLYGRAKGPFKDPNVLAPFLVLPILYCIHECIARRGLAVAVHAGMLAVLMLALLLTFSRGGWAHVALSAMLAGFLWLAASRDKRFRTRLIVFAVAGLAACAIGLVFLLDVESIGRLFEARAQLAQDYDSSGSGRFAGQWQTVLKIIDNPFGHGARGFLPEWFEQPHNVYLFMFMIGGWGGGLIYIILVGLTLAHGFRALSRPSPHNGLTVVLIATFIGLILEGLIVDTDHWRHFFVLMGCLWGVSAMAPAREAPQHLHGTVAGANAGREPSH